MPKVHFANEIVTVDAQKGQTIKEVALAQGIILHRGLFTWANCRSHGLCGSCQVWVTPLAKGAVSEPTWRERLRPKVSGTLRLGCQARVLGDIEVRTLPGGQLYEPVETTEWAADPRPSRWKDRLTQAEAGGDDDEEESKPKAPAPAPTAAAAAPSPPADPPKA